MVAAGGVEPRAEEIFKFFSDLEKLLCHKNVLNRD
jgi:hypothetical protein